MTNVINPIDAVTKATDLSARYTQINTRRLIQIAEGQGFKVASTKFPRSKKSEHSLHVVRLDLPGYEVLNSKTERPQLIIQNAHNGTSSLRLMAGVFRLVCSNGLIAGDATLNVRLRHVGLIQEEIEEQLKIAAAKTFELVDKVEKFKTTYLTQDERLQFVREALAIRANASSLSKEETTRLIERQENVVKMNRIVRHADQGDAVWEVLNRVQEHSVKASGLIYWGDDNQYHRLHGVNNIQKNVKLNQQLWELAEKFAA